MPVKKFATRKGGVGVVLARPFWRLPVWRGRFGAPSLARPFWRESFLAQPFWRGGRFGASIKMCKTSLKYGNYPCICSNMEDLLQKLNGIKRRCKSYNIVTISGEVATNMGEVNPNMGEVDPNMGEVDPNMGEVDPITGEVDPNMGEVDPSMREVDPLTGEVVTITVGLLREWSNI